MSTPGSRRPRYQIVTDTLIREIEAGRYPVGSFLPVEAELLTRFQVSRTTVREALKRLSALGLVATLHGVGTRIESRRIHTSYVVSMKSIADGVQYEGGAGEFVILHRSSVVATREDETILSTRQGQRWRRLSGYRTTPGDDSTAFAQVLIFIREPYDTAVTAKARHKIAFYSAIEKKFHLEIVRIEQEIEAIAIDQASAKTLRVAPGSPGLKVVRRYYCHESEPFEVTINIYPPNRFTYKMHLQRERG
jgi:DNA-binding GntR family transcriptional regulator